MVENLPKQEAKDRGEITILYESYWFIYNIFKSLLLKTKQKKKAKTELSAKINEKAHQLVGR